MAKTFTNSYHTPTTWLVCHGDSITAGYGTTNVNTTNANCFASLVSSSVLASKQYAMGMFNFGINGQGLNYVYNVPPSDSFGTLTADAVTRVDPVLAYSGVKYLVVFAGTNDIFLNGTTGANCWTLLQTYINARITAGWSPANICVVTMLPRQSTNESARTTFNGLIASNQVSMGYKIADAGGDAIYGAFAATANPALYPDTIHPADAGHTTIKNLVVAQLFP